MRRKRVATLPLVPTYPVPEGFLVRDHKGRPIKVGQVVRSIARVRLGVETGMGTPGRVVRLYRKGALDGPVLVDYQGGGLRTQRPEFLARSQARIEEE